ncbi:polymorphic toxin type 24 domain-containing protein [Paractinoplanes globisporus]|uniref:Polymorphic toxin type 24 domain-containing protein n=1 Tax=Paractinoplanes globisporus TaxID=113565 RepID=A0ABW6WGY9_9ACTN|nr:polymorphic toxin type 24 domain-containing protein [Actinoplanes globisporus]
MSPANPLVATAADGPADPWSGVWIAQDIEALCQGVRDGSWIEGTLGAVSAGLDALALVSDPIGSLLQYGVAWIIDHVKPLSEALDWLAGDPGQISAHAQTWRNVAGALRDRAADLERAVRWDVTEWTGSAADAYRGWVSQQQAAVGGMAQGAETLATITEAAGLLVAGVRMMVRDAIATLVSRLVVYAAEEVASFGLATALVVEQVSTLCASWAARIGTWLRDLIGSLSKLRGVAGKVGELLEKLKALLGRLGRSGHGGGGGGGKKPTKAAEQIKNGQQYAGRKLPQQGGPPNGTLYKRDPQTGDVTNYTVYDADGNAVKRVDLTGRPHGGVPTPHVVEYDTNVNPNTGQVFVRQQRYVRPATPDEIP